MFELILKKYNLGKIRHIENTQEPFLSSALEAASPEQSAELLEVVSIYRYQEVKK